MKKITLSLILISSLVLSLNFTKADENIYSKIDNLVKNNREKALDFFFTLDFIRDYTAEKLWISQYEWTILDIDFSNLYWFNLSKLDLNKYNLKFLSFNDCKWFVNDNNKMYKFLYDYNSSYSFIVPCKWKPVIFTERWKQNYSLRVYNDWNNSLYEAILLKYNNLINKKISFDSKEFLLLNFSDIDWKNTIEKNNILNLFTNFAQIKPFNQEFIKDEKWKIKWIWFYCFEWQDFPWNLKYKIYWVKDKSLMEVDLNIIEEYSWDNFSQTIDKNTWDINLENYKKIFFKNGYFEDDSKSQEYWINLKNEIEFYKEVVKNS